VQELDSKSDNQSHEKNIGSRNLEKKRENKKNKKRIKKIANFEKMLKKKEPPSKNLYHVLRGGSTHGSRSGNIVNRKPPRGGGFLSINLFMLRRYT